MAPRKLFIQLHAVVAVLAAATVAAKKPPVTHLHFYMHDIITGPSPTAVKVISTSGPTIPNFNFGDIFVIDDPLTEGPSLAASKLIGRAQGFYTLTSADPADGFPLLLTVNLVLTEGRYNGSTLAVLGRDEVTLAVRELPVVGGSGKFRLARGYVLLKTHSLNMTSGNAVLELDVYVTRLGLEP